jgi:hypothetical protein
VFETTGNVVWALKRYQDVFDPKSGSIIIPVKGRSEHTSEPFKPGFLEGIDRRDELLYRMRTRLDNRERMLLVLWYIADLKPGEVARKLGISRMHTYRLKKKALWALVDDDARAEQGDITYGGWRFATGTDGHSQAPANASEAHAYNGGNVRQIAQAKTGNTNRLREEKKNPPRMLA